MGGIELWLLVHALGAGSLLAGGVWALAEVSGLRPAWRTGAGTATAASRAQLATTVLAAGAWLAVLVATLVIYPAYRAGPRQVLLASAATAWWQTVAMEWKERLGWLAVWPLSTAAWATWRYGGDLADDGVRPVVMGLLATGLALAAVAAAVGMNLVRLAPVH